MTEHSPARLPNPNNGPASSGPAPYNGGRPAGRRGILLFGSLGVLVVLAAAVAAFLMFRGGGTGAAVKAADSFLTTAAQSPPAQSYAAASPAFRASMTLDTWASISKVWKLGGFQGSTWTTKILHGDTATLQGQLQMAGGASVPANVVLDREKDGWRVMSLQLTVAASALATDPTTQNTLAGQLAIAQGAMAKANEVTASGNNATGVAVSAPDTTAAPTTPDAAPQMAGRRGPPGYIITGENASNTCMVQFAHVGIAVDGIDCSNLFLPAIPTARGQCFAMRAGTATPVAVTFLDYDPATQQGSVNCRLMGN